MTQPTTQPPLADHFTALTAQQFRRLKFNKRLADREAHLEFVAQSRFKKGDRVQFGDDSRGRVLGHEVCYVNGKPTLALIVLLDPEYRCYRWNPLETWIETDQIRRSP